MPYITQILNIFFSKLQWTRPNDENSIYLTFDDGPIPEVTPWVLDLLSSHQIKATFFCVGENVKKHPHLFERIRQEGHQVGNHTYHHLSGWNTANDHYLKDVEQANEWIGSSLFRPPYGRLGLNQYKTLIDQYDIIMWDVLSEDYDSTKTSQYCVDKVLTQTKSGSIIVMHDSLKAENNLRASLIPIISELKKKGFQFTTL